MSEQAVGPLALVNGQRFEIIEEMPEGKALIRRPNGSKTYLAAPIRDGRDFMYGANRWRIIP